MADENLTRNKVIEQLEKETRERGFVEYPKMLHKTDGSHLTVNNKADEEAALRSADVHPTPAAAQAEKAKRDEAERAREALANGAAAAGKKGNGGKKAAEGDADKE